MRTAAIARIASAVRPLPRPPKSVFDNRQLSQSVFAAHPPSMQQELRANTTSPGWGALLRGRNLLVSLALTGGVVIQAVNEYLATTIMPSVVRDIGGLEFYAWNTTVYVVASIIGAAIASRVLIRHGARATYVWTATLFALASAACALAPSMPVLLTGRTAQDLAGGVLVAMPYALVRIVFPPALWPRALALVSGMWGVASLLGPALGGLFAELGMWRAAFWAMLPVAAFFVAMALVALPAHDRNTPPPQALPRLQLALLTLAVLAASVASVSHRPGAVLAWLLAAALLVWGFDRAQHHAPRRLLPRGSLRTSNALGALYAIQVLLALAVICTEIFVPLFLQDLHGRSPLEAGYMAALMSLGWTLGSLLCAGFVGAPRRAVLLASPLLLLAAVVALAVLMPCPGTGAAQAGVLAAILITGGFGVGISFPHLSVRVMEVAPTDEAELAASSIMTVQLCAAAFGAAIAGLVVNLAGHPGLDGTGLDSAAASRWLFGLFALAPLLATWMIWRRRHTL